MDIASPLSEADAVVQSMPDASPAKWHLAHTTWFFEAMVLVPNVLSYRPFDESFGYLFNSYYESLGERHPRPQRGLITRPSLAAVRDYRHHVDTAMCELLQSNVAPAVRALVELGCNHEQQHQELMLTDILHLFAQNPLLPAYRPPTERLTASATPKTCRYVQFEGGIREIGTAGDTGFAFDSETPRHRVCVAPYRLGDRLVTNGEWLEFMADGGYSNAKLWLAEGWATAQKGKWQAPLYWQTIDGVHLMMTLRGELPVDLGAPVAHVSYYEADAFATWSGRRLPTEAEWELAADDVDVSGNFLDSGSLVPRAATEAGADIRQLFGDLWEWTRSPFMPYPGFKTVAGPQGEYNGKFMINQMVLRGGSCVTPNGHIRPTYRNFFPPAARWQFAGVRLAEDV